jgi:hypothetical protein
MSISPDHLISMFVRVEQVDATQSRLVVRGASWGEGPHAAIQLAGARMESLLASFAVALQEDMFPWLKNGPPRPEER